MPAQSNLRKAAKTSKKDMFNPLTAEKIKIIIIRLRKKKEKQTTQRDTIHKKESNLN